VQIREVNRVLFVGTGGGNDIFSTTLAALSLWQLGWRWNEAAVAGVLSPFHRHHGLTKVMPCVLETHPESTRHLLVEDKQIGFVDATVAKMIRQEPIAKINKVLGLSLEQGTVGLCRDLIALTYQYDFFVLVDLGGDIFYRGTQDWHVLSPMFDAMVLSSFWNADVPGVIFEAGPGTDGELDPDALAEILSQEKVEAHPCHLNVLDRWQHLYQTWIAPVRPGRTVPMTLKAQTATTLMMKEEFRCRAHLGDYRQYWPFQQQISTALCRNFYLVDSCVFDNPFALTCKDPFDWFVKTQLQQNRTSNEANLEYLSHEGEVWQFVTPAPLFPLAVRKDLIARCLANLQAGLYQGAWLLPEDCTGLGSRFTITEKDGMLCLRAK
jgi:hypothetical protein